MIEVNRKGEVWVYAEQEDGQFHDVSLELCGKARELADRLGGSWDWDGDTAVCESRGAKARVGYDDANVWLDLSLPLMLKPLRRTIQTKVEEILDRDFKRS